VGTFQVPWEKLPEGILAFHFPKCLGIYAPNTLKKSWRFLRLFEIMPNYLVWSLMCKEKAWNEVNEYQTCFIEFHEELHTTPQQS
jgi:hypothetical protein